MNLAQSTILNAINHSIGRNGFANIILAGPIGVGKRETAELIMKRLNLINYQNTVSIFCEEGYFLKPDVAEPNFMDLIDSLDTFDIERYICDLMRFANNEFVYSKVRKKETIKKRKIEPIYTMQPKGNVCIYTGPHTIRLLQKSDVEILNPIYIFMNGDLKKCIQKRLEKNLLLPTYTPENLDEYIEFIISQNEKFILPQKEQADIIINCI